HGHQAARPVRRVRAHPGTVHRAVCRRPPAADRHDLHPAPGQQRSEADMSTVQNRVAPPRPRGTAVDMPAMLRLIELTDYIVAHTIRAVAELRVADHLADGPRNVADLAE